MNFNFSAGAAARYQLEHLWLTPSYVSFQLYRNGNSSFDWQQEEANKCVNDLNFCWNIWQVTTRTNWLMLQYLKENSKFSKL